MKKEGTITTCNDLVFALTRKSVDHDAQVYMLDPLDNRNLWEILEINIVLPKSQEENRYIVLIPG